MNRSELQLVTDCDSDPPLSDDELMQLIQADSNHAFRKLIVRHQGLVLGLATRFLNDTALGRDVAQDVFLALWAQRKRYRAQGRFRSFLVSMTNHRCLVVARQGRNDRKRLERLRKTSDRTVDSAETPLRQLLKEEKAARVRDKLTRLGAKQRQVLILRYTHELTWEEIAEHTKQPMGTVKSHWFRGMKRLCKILRKEAL